MHNEFKKRVSPISSTVKRAVAFFKIAFSHSRRLTRASSAWMRYWSGFRAWIFGLIPLVLVAVAGPSGAECFSNTERAAGLRNRMPLVNDQPDSIKLEFCRK